MMMANDIILDVKNLSVDYASATGTVHAVDHVSLAIRRGEIFGLAGESGSGKSTLAFAIARLLKYPAKITGGQIIFHPQPTDGNVMLNGAFDGSIDVLALSPQELRDFRWDKMAIVFQSAMNALNPVISVATQITDVIQAHDPALNARQRLDRAEELFRLVGISPDRLRSFPHQLSGGMRQRAVIAIALALNPELIILDEPTTALDVVVQRDILNELKFLRAKFGYSLLFITHDLSLLLEISDHLGIMYAGRMVEMSGQGDLLIHPLHPYTYGLIHAFPDL
jgi:peptide/nickel transport system ATP-binding protein